MNKLISEANNGIIQNIINDKMILLIDNLELYIIVLVSPFHYYKIF